MQLAEPQDRSVKALFPLLLLIILFGVVLVRTAWMSDDAYITLRTVDNFVHGYGLTWNVSERVQAYTHPLWMFILSSIYYFTREAYYTTLAISILISIITVILIVFVASRTVTGATLSIATLILAKSFVDYSTSGLENPLTHLIVVLFLILYFRHKPSPSNLFRLSLVASLGILNRMDTALIFGPPLLYAFLQRPGWRSFGALVLGQVPFLAWEGFSLFYYGFPFPNTAYAKMAVADWGRWTFVQQGMFYLLDTVDFDPLTIMTIVAGLALPLVTKVRGGLALAIGMLLHLVYVVYIGGDFMSGRMLTAVLVGAVVLVAQFDFGQLKPISIGVLFAVVVALGYSISVPTLTSNSEFSYGWQDVLALYNEGKRSEAHALSIELAGEALHHRSIADERAFYYPHSGLLERSRANGFPIDLWWAYRGPGLHTDLYIAKMVGWICYYAGPTVQIIDPMGLGDALLARMPPFRAGWGPGHLERVIPEGYLETLRSGQNQIADPDLAAYYDRLALIIKGDLFSQERLRAIWEINTGKYDHLIDFVRYRYPGMVHLKQAAISSDPEHPGKIPFGDSGVEITLESYAHQSVIEVSLEPNNDYEIVYFRDDVRLADQKVTAYHTGSEYWTYLLWLPARAAEEGFNRVWILPDVSILATSPPREMYVGHFRLLE